MPLPKISTLNNVFINGVLNPQWNANGGTFGLLNPANFITSTYGANGYGQNFYGGVVPNSATPYVQATSTPSFFGASAYDSSSSSFSANIVVPTGGNGSIQTSLVIKQDEYNYVEMFYGPNGKFGGYSSNGGVPSIPTQLFPTYSSVAHAYWRIRNDSILFYFDTSPDGSTWTNIASVGYTWDTTNVTVMFFSGYTGTEPQGLQSFINHINQNTASLTLSAKVPSISFVHGNAVVTNPNALSGRASGFNGRNSAFHANVGIPQGGMTDFAIGGVNRSDPATARSISYFQPNITGGSTVNWSRPYNTFVPATIYRDGSYWTPAKTAVLQVGAQVIDSNQQIFTNVQMEKMPGSFNRLSPNIAFYTDTCEFVAQKSLSSNGVGSQSVVRSPLMAYAGNYSGQMIFGGAPAVDGSGHNAYWPYPTRKALTPIIANTLGQEIIRGSVSLSTTRAGTQWYPALALYDVNFNLLSQSTFISASTPTLVTHPGGGAWQTASVLLPTGVTSAVWASVVPVVIVPGTSPETVYMSGHTIAGITPPIAGYPTSYVDPQQYTITLKPDRLNYALNSGFTNNIAGWTEAAAGISGTPDSLTVSWDGTTGFNSLGSLKAHLAAPTGSYTGTAGAKTGPAGYLVNTSSSVFPTIQGLKVGHTYTFSAWIKKGPGCPDINMHIIDSNYNGLYNTSLSSIQNSNPGASQGGWTNIYATFTIPPNGGSDYRLWFTVQYTDILALAPFDFWVDSILVEETNLVGTYFDGGIPSPDYQYELQGGVNNRSYYYKDYTNKLSRVNTIIPQFSPLASSFNILTAQPPT